MIDLKNADLFSVMTGIKLMPSRMSATLKFKLMKIRKEIEPLVKDCQLLKAEFIKNNFPEITIKDMRDPKKKGKKVKIEVNEQLIEFMNPWYLPPKKIALLDSEGKPIKDEKGDYIIDEERSKKAIEIQEAYKEAQRIFIALDREKNYVEYCEELDEFVNVDLNIPLLDHNDFLGVNLDQSEVMEFLKPILKL